MNNLANKEVVLKCLEARKNGANIQEANKYIQEIEVFFLIISFFILIYSKIFII